MQLTRVVGNSFNNGFDMLFEMDVFFKCYSEARRLVCYSDSSYVSEKNIRLSTLHCGTNDR